MIGQIITNSDWTCSMNTNYMGPLHLLWEPNGPCVYDFTSMFFAARYNKPIKNAGLEQRSTILITTWTES